AAERAAFLAALNAGRATLAVQGDQAGSVLQSFPLSSVTIVRLDAQHQPLPAGSTATPAYVRFEGLAGHFSTYAVVILPTWHNPLNALDVNNDNSISSIDALLVINEINNADLADRATGRLPT